MPMMPTGAVRSAIREVSVAWLWFIARASMGWAGWGARIRTWEWRNQNPLPYRLATPHRAANTRRRDGRTIPAPRVAINVAATLTRQAGPMAAAGTAAGRLRASEAVAINRPA